jgi:hypothetical protein
LVTKSKEANPTETEHGEHKDNLEDSKKNEREPKSKLKIETEMGECIHSIMQVPFHVEAKVDIKSYGGEVDAIKLNQWLQQMEVYFSMH